MVLVQHQGTFFGNGQMVLVKATEYCVCSVSKSLCGQCTPWLYDPTLAMRPFRWMGFNHGLWLGNWHLTIRTPCRLCLTRRLLARDHPPRSTSGYDRRGCGGRDCALPPPLHTVAARPLVPFGGYARRCAYHYLPSIVSPCRRSSKCEPLPTAGQGARRPITPQHTRRP